MQEDNEVTAAYLRANTRYRFVQQRYEQSGEHRMVLAYLKMVTGNDTSCPVHSVKRTTAIGRRIAVYAS